MAKPSTAACRRSLFLTGLLLALTLSTGLAEGARARTLGLGDMAGRAGRIFVGRCTGWSVDHDPAGGLPSTTYTFVVTDPIKGVDRGPTTVRMPGTPDRPLLPGLPVFRRGEEVLLLLYPESGAGFSTPMGLDQGRFRILQRPDGSRKAVNGRGNVRLLEDVPESVLQPRGLAKGHGRALAVGDLVGTLRELVGGGRP